MKPLYYYISLALLLSFTACTKNFKELAENPNANSKVLPEALLAPALKNIVSYNMNRSQRITNELMQVTINMGDGDGKIFRYDIKTSEADYLWNNWYLELKNIKDIYTFGADLEQTNYMAISLICQSWVFSMLTDTYGDIPYTQALRGEEKNFTPVFDQQQDIYPALLDSLERANQLLKSNTDIKSTSDPIFHGDILKWRKFGNSLYLRLLLRIANKEPEKVAAKIKAIVADPVEYPIMTSNDESAILRWDGSTSYPSPFANWRPGDWYGPRLTNFFVDNLTERSDPRIEKWATLYEGEYAGVPSGYPVGQHPVGKSSLPTDLMTEPLLGNIMNYAEVQFILAEAVVRGWITEKPAKDYYEEGIKAAIQLWGYELPENYLTGEHVQWNDEASETEKLNQLFLQKYYALFFTDLETWFEYRRTGYPEIPKGAGLQNNGVMPARLNYPVYIQSTNAVNYRAAVDRQGPDNIQTEVWWQTK
ncbi:SusD/RagB family nutrient-binding outer membrane lipoprotein [Olivibacter ginsenosidimutans]|uniref:SusD/RagB family nutrient-binding outer membrane lipoprotein n=2 Tax=Olivibacter ginsenosidimutans TaxID=1176537 RepID=A0ABP9CB43_9SPHI